MLKRNDYIELIEEIRNTEKKSLDEFIEKRLKPLIIENKYFIETLYKDIYYLIKDIDKEKENDLAINNGHLVIVDRELKLIGYQSRLHNLSIWLHSEIVKKFMAEDSYNFVGRMGDFERGLLERPNYTPEYKLKLDRIKKSLKEERRQNLNEKENLWTRILDIDNFELKPNIAGIGLNINEIIKKFRT